MLHFDFAMKRFLLFLLALLLLNSTTELHELCRLPALLQHYQEHKKKDSRLSFPDFLALHYTGSHPDDNDEEEDNELPFKSVSYIVHTDIPVAANPVTDLPCTWIPVSKQLADHPEGLLRKSDKSFFHPPPIF